MWIFWLHHERVLCGGDVACWCLSAPAVQPAASSSRFQLSNDSRSPNGVSRTGKKGWAGTLYGTIHLHSCQKMKFHKSRRVPWFPCLTTFARLFPQRSIIPISIIVVSALKLPRSAHRRRRVFTINRTAPKPSSSQHVRATVWRMKPKRAGGKSVKVSPSQPASSRLVCLIGGWGGWFGVPWDSAKPASLQPETKREIHFPTWWRQSA